MGVRPLYVIKLSAEGYMSDRHAWQKVEKKRATWMNHSDARARCGYMRRLGYKEAQIEPVEMETEDE